MAFLFNHVEALLFGTALVCAYLTRPWRLLLIGSRYELIMPITFAIVALPIMWWWPAGAWNPLASLIGANLVLLCVGWPLAIFLFALAAMWGVLIDHATWGAALDMAFWRGALPATLAMALGYVARLGIPPCPPSYLLARGLLIPFAVTVICGFASLVVRADFAAIGDAAPAAITLVATLDAMLTGMVVMSLVLANPRALATWSDELYLGDDAARTAAAMRSSLEPHAAPASALKQRKNQP